MAVIQYSALVTQLRGKLGGSQFNKGHAGYSLQRKSDPTIKQTSAQLRMRQIVSTVQRSWKEAAQAVKMEAAQAAASNPTTDRFGQQVILSGYNHYVKRGIWRVLDDKEPTDNFITVPVSSFQTEIEKFSLTIIPHLSGEVIRLRLEYRRSPIGSPTGPPLENRIFVFVRAVDSNGNPIGGQREVLAFITSGGTSSSSVAEFGFDWGFYAVPGSWVQFRVVNRQMTAGAQTSDSRYIFQID